ncbi:flagellar biosynthesis protein FlgA [Rhodococcus sp. AD45-ID]|uniref:SAF domain-containing protein n=1 Tax=unclassified Rhodococcus (in: high G+C Gram-positive bacteria) TaxID=192944 RepID=UPI0005D43962|nr:MULTISPECIES: SAF domain-containing protein [unclassified Rhodococcus (in: high G+C Gram-positive bacteria)]KJF21367.1 flagellar basal body P-ring biosynthesis protein FlgA [Rhodococcus sp. AD45]PSR38860.1 flagellar biosynthesis protein FlgA [Rhodococcus sp. AD45-ID]
MPPPSPSGLFRARSRSHGRSRPQNFGEVDLTPSVVDRLVAIAKPNRARGSAVRKIAALTLAVLGIALLFRGDPDSDTVQVVTAARDVAPGQLVTDDDLGISEFSADHLPDGTLTDFADVVGSTVAGPVRRGEIVTDVRVLGSRLARESTGTDDARIVPVRLADAAVSDIVRSGDIVDVLTVEADTPNEQTNDNNPTILASGAVVVMVTAAESTRNQQEQVIMLALPTEAATRVAAASLVNAITVTFK